MALNFFFFSIILLPVIVVPAAAQMKCEDLTTLELPDTVVTLATPVAVGPFTLPNARPGAAPIEVPAFCRVAATIRPEVHIELWMPRTWNKKLMAVGNGGLAGTINYSALLDPLRRGYAASSTDTGHVADNDGKWAQGHMQRVIDFAHRSVHVMAQADKAIMRAFYGAPPEHSYFNGCSQGGQQAMTEAQRYPEDFDGIIAGNPANYWTHLYMGGHVWVGQVTLSNPDSYISSAKAAMIGAAVYAACDSIDGITDGILNDPRRCRFDPATLLCKGDDAPDCLTRLQVEAARRIYQGARTSTGEEIFPGIMPGAETGTGGWANWITGNAPGRGSHLGLGIPFFRHVVFDDPNWDFRDFRFDRIPGFDSDVDFTDAKLGSIFNNMNPDLRRFQAKGGKLLHYHGWADPDISPLNSINYHQSVAEFMSRPENASVQTKDFYRLFMVPGMQHCSGGPGPNSFDVVGTLEKWVEAGTAPDRIVASHSTNGTVDRTRPLCPYPQEAQWNGSGSTDSAENFSCVVPPAR